MSRSSCEHSIGSADSAASEQPPATTASASTRHARTTTEPDAHRMGSLLAGKVLLDRRHVQRVVGLADRDVLERDQVARGPDVLGDGGKLEAAGVDPRAEVKRD